MALGKPGRSDGKAYSLRLRLKSPDGKFLESAVYDVQEKQGDAYVTTGQETDVAGDLVKIEPRSFDHDEFGTIRSFKIALKDANKNEIYFTEQGLGNSLGRGLANSILNLAEYDKKGKIIGITRTENVQIGLYGQKNKETKITYPAVSLRQGDKDETVKWKYDPKAEKSPVPAPREYEGKVDPKTKKPKIEKDWSAVEVFFFDKLTEFAAVLDAAPKPAKVVRAAAPAPAGAADQNDGATPDPF